MNWIEQLFGIDPDLGGGSLELLIAAGVVVVGFGLVLTHTMKSRHEKVD